MKLKKEAEENFIQETDKIKKNSVWNNTRYWNTKDIWIPETKKKTDYA